MLLGSSGKYGVWLTILLATFLLMSLGACGTSGDDVEDVPLVEDDTGSVPDLVADPDVCVPDCGARTCGDNGCGGLCGHCLTMEGAVNDDLCLDDGTCTPCGCGEQECGQDLCGSPCGNCPGFWVCNDLNTCEPPPVNCDFNGFHSVDDYAKAFPDATGGFNMFYRGLSQATPPFNVLRIEIDTALGGPPGPGTYDLAYDSFATNGLVTYVLNDWADGGYAGLYVPTAGTIEITSLSGDGGKFKAILHDAVLEEASYNGDTLAADFVPHGKIFCLDNIAIDSDLLVTEPFCVETGTGFSIGDNIANFKLQRCDGEWIDLHDSCEVYKSIWIVGTAGW
jgi:hypothetical protein